MIITGLPFPLAMKWMDSTAARGLVFRRCFLLWYYCLEKGHLVWLPSKILRDLGLLGGASMCVWGGEVKVGEIERVLNRFHKELGIKVTVKAEI